MGWEAYDPGLPGPGEARLRQEAVGRNFIDIYHRTGLYPLSGLPAVPGLEGAGVVESVGTGVSNVKPGDQVAYAGIPVGMMVSDRPRKASHRWISDVLRSCQRLPSLHD